ncbi:LOW QUALITY PROTEIN: hypothetical protein ACHAXA_010712 [Cyclostephanos tholiformis]|uniref:Uncharacterized protein n=1 Tax=Cyclostephanos tholiformis TaxID=382380 RepID=A0ABD3R1N1_9STRA
MKDGLDNYGRSSRYHSFTTGTYTGTCESTNNQGMNPYTSGRWESQMSSSQHNNSAPYDGSAQYDNLSPCASISGTTVANGGHGRCPYQIAFQVQNMGKQVSSSKRIISFRFGFANASAMSQGKTGTDCRGEEHEIVVTWSITGGKRLISMDSREIQYSAGKVANEPRRADVLEASWRMSDRVYILKCYAYKPAEGSPEKRNPRWKQYSLFIDGRSFFELPQIFDLGLKGLTKIVVPVATIHSNDRTSISGLSASMGSIQTNQSLEVKNEIQSRIDEQRNLLNARKQAMKAEGRKARAQHGTSHSIGANTNDTSVESVGLDSGVFSAAPSELDEVTNRKQLPLATTSACASPSSAQNRLGQYKGHHADRPQPTQPNSRQHQIAYTSQHPPTYEEITRDILGAYNSREPITTPDKDGINNRIEFLDISERTDSSHLVVRSDDASLASSDLTYVSKASFSPAKLNYVTKPPYKTPKSNIAKGINKWGFY